MSELYLTSMRITYYGVRFVICSDETINWQRRLKVVAISIMFTKYDLQEWFDFLFGFWILFRQHHSKTVLFTDQPSFRVRHTSRTSTCIHIRSATVWHDNQHGSRSPPISHKTKTICFPYNIVRDRGLQHIPASRCPKKSPSFCPLVASIGLTFD